MRLLADFLQAPGLSRGQRAVPWPGLPPASVYAGKDQESRLTGLTLILFILGEVGKVTASTVDTTSVPVPGLPTYGVAADLVGCYLKA